MKYTFIKPVDEVLQLVKNISQRSKRKYICFSIRNYLVIINEFENYIHRIPKKPIKEKHLTLLFIAL